MRESVGVPEGLGIVTARGWSVRRTRAGAVASDVGARLSLVYLLGGGLALVCYLLPPVAGSTWLFELTGLSAAVAIAVGVVRYRPRPVVPWVLFVVAQLVFVAGDFFYYTYDLSFHRLPMRCTSGTTRCRRPAWSS